MLAMPTCTHDFDRLQVYRDHTTVATTSETATTAIPNQPQENFESVDAFTVGSEPLP